MKSKENKSRSFFAIVVMMIISVPALAQHGGSLSSYSRLGLGLVCDEAQGWNASMGGVGVALPSGNRLNTINPASYAYIDSLSFIFDAGMSAGFGHMKQGGNSLNMKYASLDYISTGWRLRKNLGFAIGFRPYTTIGYTYSATDGKFYRNEETNSLRYSMTSYTGSGGLNRVFAGVGWRPFSHFSFGTNVSVLWGSYARTMLQTIIDDGSTSSSAYDINYLESADITTFLVDFGAQYAFHIGSHDWMTVGLTYGLGHKVKACSYLTRYMTDARSDAHPSDSINDAIDVPHTVSAGLAWHHKNNLIVAADMGWQGWGKCNFPLLEGNSTTLHLVKSTAGYRDMYKVKIGCEYTPDAMNSHSMLKRSHYRFGISYNTPYMRSNGVNTAAETCLSIGIGLPIMNRINNRSVFNFGLQWINRTPSDRTRMVTENYVMFNIGLTFNERWFMKFKIQ